MNESRILRDVREDVSRGPIRLFRNNVGTGWAGGGGGRRATRATPENLSALRAALRPGDVVVPAARPLHAGLQVGSGDGIGWVSHVIRPEDAGRLVAVFASVETKTAAGRLRPEQANWLEQVQAAGGLAGVARSVEEARGVLQLPAPES